jgi:hypothetical protein
MVESKFTGVSTAIIIRQYKALVARRTEEAAASPSSSKDKSKRRKATHTTTSSSSSLCSTLAHSGSGMSHVDAAAAALAEQYDQKLCELKRAVFMTWTDDTDGRMALLSRVQAMMGFRFTPKAEIELPQRLRIEAQPIHRTDLDQIGERIKHMNIVLQVEGILLMIRGFQTRAHDTRSAIQYFSMAIKKFEEELNSNTNSKVLYCIVLYRSAVQLGGLTDRST